MARTKVTPRKSAGGKAPRFRLEMLVAHQLLEIVHATAKLQLDSTTVADLNGAHASRPAFFPSVGAYFEAFARRTHPDTVARLLRASAVQGDDPLPDASRLPRPSRRRASRARATTARARRPPPPRWPACAAGARATASTCAAGGARRRAADRRAPARGGPRAAGRTTRPRARSASAAGRRACAGRSTAPPSTCPTSCVGQERQRRSGRSDSLRPDRVR